MRRRLVRNQPPPPSFCHFCENNSLPDYKDAKALNQFLASRGRIVARSKSGLCQKHQKRLAIAIKRARHLAMLPFEAK